MAVRGSDENRYTPPGRLGIAMGPMWVVGVLLVALLAGCSGPSASDDTGPTASRSTSTTARPATDSSTSTTSKATSTPKPSPPGTPPLEVNVSLAAPAQLYQTIAIVVTVNRDATLILNETTFPLTSGRNDLTMPGRGPGPHSWTWVVQAGTSQVTGTLSFTLKGQPLQFPVEPTSSHTIRPGISSEVCTTNYLFHYAYVRYFIGTAAHCIDGAASPNGSCEVTEARIGAAESLEFGVTGTIAYSSWTSMNRLGISGDECSGNDFGLIEIAPSDWSKIHPMGHGIIGHVKGLGDCRAMDGGTAGLLVDGDEVVAYGRSNLRTGLDVLPHGPDRPEDDKTGWLLGVDYGGLQCHVYLATPGIPGDSGGPLATVEGLALGAASTVTLIPTVGSNRYTNIAAALERMAAYEGWAPELLLG